MGTQSFTSYLLSLAVATSLAANVATAAGKAPRAKGKAKAATPQLEESQSDVSDSIAYMKARQHQLDGRLEDAAELLEKVQKNDPENPVLARQLAESYLRLGQLDKAEELTRKLLVKDDKNTDLHQTLAEIFTEQKRYADAKVEYDRILELDPQNKRAALYIGMLQTETSDYDAAVATFTKVIDSNPDNLMAYYYRARVQLLRDDHEAAKQDLQKCLQLRPSFVEAGTVLGMLLEKVGQTDEAIAAYASIQGNGRFRKRLAQLYQQKGDLKSALEALIEYEEVEPDDFTAQVRIGIYHLELKEYERAIARFEQLLHDHPDADNVRFYLGVVHLEQKNNDQSLREFRRIGKDSAFFREAMIQAALILKDLKRDKEGLAFAKGLVTKHPEISEFFDLHASFLESTKDFKGALSVVEAGLKRHATDERLLYFRGILLERVKRRDEAIDAMRKVLEVNERNPHALNFIGYTWAERGEKLDEAEAMVRKALELRPTDGFIEDSLGWVLYQRGRLDEAEKHLLKAVEMQPKEAVILEHLGDVYLKRGAKDKARETYKKAVDSAVGDATLEKKLREKLSNVDGGLPATTPPPPPRSNAKSP